MKYKKIGKSRAHSTYRVVFYCQIPGKREEYRTRRKKWATNRANIIFHAWTAAVVGGGGNSDDGNWRNEFQYIAPSATFFSGFCTYYEYTYTVHTKWWKFLFSNSQNRTFSVRRMMAKLKFYRITHWILYTGERVFRVYDCIHISISLLFSKSCYQRG